MSFSRDFGRKAAAALARKGITLVRPMALPDETGSFFNPTTGYVVNDNGCGRVWTYFEVRKAAGL
jgi:hypothetical protein